MSRLLAGLAVVVAAWCAAACERTEPGAGSSTNWLRPCDEDSACAEGTSCRCGVCTQGCEGACTSLPDARCVEAASAPARAQCEGTAEAGLCLPRCGATADCATGQVCTDGACVSLAPPSPESAGCGAGASLQLFSLTDAFYARYGTTFSGALYLPVEYAEPPADWSEPAPPAAFIVRVTGPAGEPVEGCAVRLITGEGSGVAFAETPTTSVDGELTAHWVAGDARRQALLAALVRDDGTVATAQVEGLAYANDEEPTSDAAERAATARPSTLRLNYALPEEESRVRVSVTPHTFPHHAFYAAIARDGFFTGLQNTSNADAATGEVPSEDRALIASVWNLAEGDAQQLFGVAELSCAAHDQDLGGVRCMLPGAWEPESRYVFELERRALAEGESVAEYAELGYATDPCASAAGCTDYTVWFGADGGSELRRVVAYRYPSADVAPSFSSFVQAYADLPEQNSCVATPRYDVSFSPAVERDGAFTVVAQASFSADYASWHNEVCANYAASTSVDGYRLATGGPSPSGRPQLPGEPPRLLELP